MAASLIIDIYYYEENFYLPTVVRSLSGMVSVTDPIAIVPADDRAALTEEIELRAIAGNATLTNADFRVTSDNKVVDAMRLPNRISFFTRAKRWTIVEEDGVYTLFPYKPAPMRGVVRDVEHAMTLNPATFAKEAIEHMDTMRAK